MLATDTQIVVRGGLVRLTKHTRELANPGTKVWVNPDFIALMERYDSDGYTRVELAGSTVIKVVETPDQILTRGDEWTIREPKCGACGQPQTSPSCERREHWLG